MTTISVMIHGFGNIGKYAVQALEASPDMQCVGVLRLPFEVGTRQADLRGVPDFSDLEKLVAAVGLPQVAIICGPSREAPADAARYLKAGMHTVDSFDIHDEIPALVKTLHSIATDNGKTAISGAGWDPGTDSVVRALFEAMAPVGTTFTNFGRGRSMGHSVAARMINGVANAVSITVPAGGGRHSRLVYVLPEQDAVQDEVCRCIAADPYFCNDPLDIRFVPSQEALNAVVDESHGVLLERIGASGFTANQQFHFDMRINNPALTSQVLVSAARAATRMAPGSYTLVDVPPVALLPGSRMDNIARLV